MPKSDGGFSDGDTTLTYFKARFSLGVTTQASGHKLLVSNAIADGGPSRSIEMTQQMAAILTPEAPRSQGPWAKIESGI